MIEQRRKEIWIEQGNNPDRYSHSVGQAMSEYAKEYLSSLQSKGKTKEEVLKNLDVLEQCFEEAPIDFLGTGSNSREADKECSEWNQKWRSSIENIKQAFELAESYDNQDSRNGFAWTDADIEEAFYDGGRKSNGQPAFNVLTWFPYFKQAKMNERREEYAQSHANKDGGVTKEDFVNELDKHFKNRPDLNKEFDRIDSLIASIRICVRPIRGHNDPKSINDCFEELEYYSKLLRSRTTLPPKPQI